MTAVLRELSCNTVGARNWPGASLCGSALLSSLFTLKNAACVCSGDNSSLQALPAASRHIRCSSSFPFPQDAPNLLPPSPALPDLQLSPFSMQRLSHKLPGLISAWLQRASSLLCVSQCDWELFSSQLPPYSKWAVRDPYPSASSISNLSLPKFPFKFSGSTNPCPKGGFSLPLFCRCANQHSRSDGRYPSNGKNYISPYICVCVCTRVCTGVCTGKGLCVRT